MSSQPDADRPHDDGMPSHGARTTVNFLLFVHLFTVGVLMVFAGSNSGLRPQLRRIPGYYLQVLGMDVDFDSGQRYNLGLEYDEITQRHRRIAEHLKYIEEEPTRRHAAETDLTFISDEQEKSPHDPSRRGIMHLTLGGALDVPYSVELHYTANLFRLPLGPESELEAGRIPSALRKAFKDNNEPLPESAAASVVEAGRQWQIDTDSRRYVVRRAAATLNVGESRRVGLPDPEGIWPHQRYLRYQMLAREVGRLVAVEDVRDLLPAALTTGIIRSNPDLSFAELDQSGVRFVCLRRISQQELQWRMQTLGAQPPEDPRHDFWFHMVYQRTPQVIGGQIRFSQIETNTRDYAPAVADPAKSSDGEDAKQNDKP